MTSKRKREHSSTNKHRMGLERPPSSCNSSTMSMKHNSLASSRLLVLATPRRSSSWKKPIHSKFSQEAQSQLNHGTFTQSRNKRRRDSNTSVELRDPKNSKASEDQAHMHSLSATAKSLSRGSLSSEDNNICPENDGIDHGIAPDILSTPIIASVINHPYDSSCPPPCVVKHAVLALQQEVIRLANEVAVKNEYIEELEAKVTRRNNHQEMPETPYCNLASSNEVQQLKQALSAEVKRLSKVMSPELEPWTLTKETPSKDNEFEQLDQISPFHSKRQDSFGDFVVSLSEELDSKIEEIRDIEHVKKTSSTSGLSSDINQAHHVNELVSSLQALKNEYSDLRRSSMESIKLANTELEKNYDKIMKYVKEESESTRNNETCAANAILQLELEKAHCENSRLKTELIRIQEEVKAGASPMPDEESWAEFSERIRQALKGGEELPDSNRKLDFNGTLQVEALFNELCFLDSLSVMPKK